MNQAGNYFFLQGIDEKKKEEEEESNLHPKL